MAQITIPDNVPAGVTSTVRISDGGMVKQVKVNVDITHTYIGDLIVELTGPGGQKAVLHNRAGGSKDNLIVSYDTATTAALDVFNGQNAQGDWVLGVKDVADRDVGKLIAGVSNWRPTRRQHPFAAKPIPIYRFLTTIPLV